MGFWYYSRTKNFLDAVSQYSEIDELRSAAQALLPVTDTLLAKRLEYLSEISANATEFESNFFLENVYINLLKETKEYASDEVVRWFVDGAEGAIECILSLGTFTFKTMMLVGDLGFGTSDTYNRYQEILALADIAQALSNSIQNMSINTSANCITIGKIQEKNDLCKVLLTTHARGEYLLYALLMQDAGLLSQFRSLSETLNNNKSTDDWYEGQIEVIHSYSNKLNKIFDVSRLYTPESKDDATSNYAETENTTIPESDVNSIVDNE